jgi:hypothetical protein
VQILAHSGLLHGAEEITFFRNSMSDAEWWKILRLKDIESLTMLADVNKAHELIERKASFLDY